MSRQEALETIELRALLEGQNARLAARRLDAQVQKRITLVLDKGARAVAAGHFDQLAALNQQFHKELTLAGANSVLAELLTRLRDRTEMLFAPTEPGRQSQAWDEHAAILRAIVAGDEHAAATLAAHHVTRAGEDFLAGELARAG
jgi:DNA-binding GntR family transcriptional regulator